MAPRLEADEPVADAGQRGEEDAVRDGDVADAETGMRGVVVARRSGGEATRRAGGGGCGLYHPYGGEVHERPRRRRGRPPSVLKRPSTTYSFISQINRSPVRVSRSSTSSTISQWGTIVWAWPPVAMKPASVPSSRWTRRAIASTAPAKP